MTQEMQKRIARLALVITMRKSPELEVVWRACLLEKNSAGIRREGEPDLPKGYRHVRSAIGALLTIGREYTF